MGKPIGEYLVEAGLLQQSQIDMALREQRATGRKLGEIIVAHGWLQVQTIEYWMKNVIIPHRNVIQRRQQHSQQQQQAAAKQIFRSKPPAPPPLPRLKPPEDTLLIEFEQTPILVQAVPPEPPPKVNKNDIQHQETLILERKDLPPLG